MSLPRPLGLLCILVLLVPVPKANAWAGPGHRVVARIAVDHLTPAALSNVRWLLSDDDLASVSTWADEIIPQHPATRRWHYVNIPASAAGYDPGRDCPDGSCVVVKIQQFSAMLADSSQPARVRREALMWLVHLVGDIHQPLHAFAEARGGNDLPVAFFDSESCGRNACNLHAVWDAALLEHAGESEDRYGAKLERWITRRHLSAGSMAPAAWANESFRLAKQAMVAPGTDLDDTYYHRELPVMNRQLALAGLRLASLLNRDLGRPS